MSPTLRRRDFILSASAAALAAGLGAAPALALSTSQAESFVRDVIAQVTALVNSGQPPRAQAPQFRRLFERYAAAPQVTSFVMGRKWREMSPDQQARFQDAFLTYVANVYTGLLSKYNGQTIEITGSKDFGAKGVLVYSVARGAGANNAKVEWQVSDRGGRIELVDLIIEGVSLLQTQRQEFAGMLDKRGGDVERLIADLRAG